MKKRNTTALFKKILVPVIHGCQSESALNVARAIAGDSHIVLVGIVHIPENDSLSAAAVPARQVRAVLQEYKNKGHIRVREHVRVSHTPWKELTEAVEKENPDLLLLEWPAQFDAMHVTPADVFSHPPCDIAVFSGTIPPQLKRVLLPMRGGPYAELALRLSLSTVHTNHANLTSLHIKPANATQDAPFLGIDRILKNLPEVTRQEIVTDDPASAILAASRQFDLVVMGATAQSAFKLDSIGPVADRILHESQIGVIVIKTKRPMPANFGSEESSQTAISVLVDKWFAENTYHANEFDNLESLLDLKRKQNVSISLALPALNEEETVGNVIRSIKNSLMDSVPLLDEIVLIDSDSTDRTREIALDLNVPVHIHQSTLPRYGARRGKGEALWKSLYLTRGDIILWIDTDIVNIHPRFIYGLLGPLLVGPEIQFIKGFYRRPLKVGQEMQAGAGGRVTELTARPLLNLFYPELSGVIQPLSGEYGGRRAALEQLPFSTGYGVEIGLLIDVFEKFGLGAIAQVDLQERVHHNQPLEALSKMSFAIIQTVIHKLERRYGWNAMEEVNKTMKLIRYEPGRFFLDVEEIAERERPPMLELPEYLERNKPSLHSET